MNRLRGYIEKEVGGKVRGFKFGTNATAIMCELEGCGLAQLGEAFQTSAWAQHHLIMSAAIANCRSKNLEVDFNRDQVGDWIDELTERGELKDVMDTMEKASLGPNDQTLRAERRETEAKTAKV